MARKRKINRIDYCQYILSTQINYTLTYAAQYKDGVSHDAYNNYLGRESLSPKLIWEHVKNEIVTHEHGYVVFDDTVLDKDYSHNIDLVRRQYSGNEKSIIKGIGVVNAVYVNPQKQHSWVIDYRIYAPDMDGKSKLDHMLDMLKNVIFQKRLPFYAVLMDTWYATTLVMQKITDWGKVFYCPIKSNRLVSEVESKYHHIPVSEVIWNDQTIKNGKTIHLNGFPANSHLQLFRIETSTSRTDFIVTNEKLEITDDAVQDEYDIRWKVEELHRELKQLTGVEKCQCRKQRKQRNHIACAYLVWVKLKSIAYRTGKTIYQIKNNLLDSYMTQELRNPQIKFDLA